MRAFVALFLCLTVAFQGIANAHAFKHPCPMEQGKKVVMPDVSGATHDCCNDADTAAKTGKPCKTGQECSLLQACTVISDQALTQAPASSPQVPTATPVTPSFDPFGVWRPPTSS